MNRLLLVISATIAGYITFNLHYFLSIFVAPDITKVLTAPITDTEWFLGNLPNLITFFGIEGFKYYLSFVDSLIFGLLIGLTVGYLITSKLFLRIFLWSTLIPVFVMYFFGMAHFTEISNGQVTLYEIASIRHDLILLYLSHLPTLFIFIFMGQWLRLKWQPNKRLWRQ